MRPIFSLASFFFFFSFRRNRDYYSCTGGFGGIEVRWAGFLRLGAKHGIFRLILWRSGSQPFSRDLKIWRQCNEDELA